VARAAGAACLQLDYRLAPEFPFPAAVEDASAAVDWLLARGFDASRIVVVGDSAGGGLTLASLIARRDQKLALPAGAVCVSPWCNLLPTGQSYLNRGAQDPMIAPDLVSFLAAQYLRGKDPLSPTASPLHADLHGLPPLLIQVGEREVLFSEAMAVAEKALEAGVDVYFEEWAGMVHVWHLYYPILRAGRDAMVRVGEFARALTVSHARKAAASSWHEGMIP
jgi:acetyl esterase/lipase